MELQEASMLFHKVHNPNDLLVEDNLVILHVRKVEGVLPLAETAQKPHRHSPQRAVTATLAIINYCLSNPEPAASVVADEPHKQKTSSSDPRP